jgi:ribosomal peptide maturation radical SAM protein 1
MMSTPHSLADKGAARSADSIGDNRLLLVNLPWASYKRPSIQLGLLAKLGREVGWQVETAHLNLEAAALIGAEAYEVVSENRSTSLGEWLFARAAFGDDAPDPEAYIKDYGSPVMRLFEQRGIEVDISDLVNFREREAEQLIARLVDQVIEPDLQLCGLTSTFQQNCAVFAFARRTKAVAPNVKIVAGGANFDSVMGPAWMRAIAPIDLIVTGEADEAFPLLLRALAGSDDLASVPNLLWRNGENVVPPSIRRPFNRLEDSPTPDYDEYFVRAERLSLLPVASRREVDLPFESSRGCWWGERRHCTFCGLNGQTMAYRAKSSERVFSELAELSSRYRTFRFAAVDNILDMGFHKTLLPQLAERRTSYDLFFEVKSGLSRQRLQELRDAGVTRIQPGIESLSSPVLALMSKGVSAAANINLLRWAKVLKMDVSWNIIWGFPGETKAHYRQQIKLLSHLVHLQPPSSSGRIWIERFSPIFAQRTAAEGPKIVPEKAMRYIYPGSITIDDAAYFFEYDLETEVDPATYQELNEAAERWKGMHAQAPIPRLEYRYAPGFLQIDDTRIPNEPKIYTYEGETAELYHLLTDGPVPLATLAGKTSMTQTVIETLLEELTGVGLALVDGGHVLALAVPPDQTGL